MNPLESFSVDTDEKTVLSEDLWLMWTHSPEQVQLAIDEIDRTEPRPKTLLGLPVVWGPTP